MRQCAMPCEAGEGRGDSPGVGAAETLTVLAHAEPHRERVEQAQIRSEEE